MLTALSADTHMSKTTINSAEFLQRLLSGDHEAIVILWREGWKHMKWHYRVLNLSNVAEDLWSHAIAKLLEMEFVNFDPKKSALMTWVINVARRVAVDYKRKQNRELEASIENADQTYSLEFWRSEKKSGSSELRTLMKRALESLGQNERTIILQRFVEGLSFKLIAENFGISENTARVRVSRAKKKLKLEFERLCSRELRKRLIRSGRRHSRRAASQPPQKKAQVAQTY